MIGEGNGVEIRRRIHNGVVDLEGEPQLLEGVMVFAVYPISTPALLSDQRLSVRLPLVPSDRRG